MGLHGRDYENSKGVKVRSNPLSPDLTQYISHAKKETRTNATTMLKIMQIDLTLTPLMLTQPGSLA